MPPDIVIDASPEKLLPIVLDQAEQIRELREDVKALGLRAVLAERALAELTPSEPSSPLEHGDASPEALGDGSPA